MTEKSTPQTLSKETAEQHLADYLRGAARRDTHYLKQILQYQDWQQAAQRRIELEASRFINALDSETLAAVADGTANIHAVASKVLEEVTSAS